MLPAEASESDVSLATLGEATWFMNPWQNRLAHPAVNGAAEQPNMSLTAGNQPIGEEEIYGLPAITSASGLPTWEEAADRIVYASHNLRRVALCP